MGWESGWWLEATRKTLTINNVITYQFDWDNGFACFSIYRDMSLTSSIRTAKTIVICSTNSLWFLCVCVCSLVLSWSFSEFLHPFDVQAPLRVASSSNVRIVCLNVQKRENVRGTLWLLLHSVLLKRAKVNFQMTFLLTLWYVSLCLTRIFSRLPPSPFLSPPLPLSTALYFSRFRLFPSIQRALMLPTSITRTAIMSRHHVTILLH